MVLPENKTIPSTINVPSGKFDLNDYVEEHDSEDLIRKLQLQEDEKLAREL